MNENVSMKISRDSVKVFANFQGLPRRIERDLEKELDNIGNDVRNNIMHKMRNTKRNSVVTGTGHSPSIPGEPPAPDTGRLINSIEIFRIGGHLEIGTNVVYAKFLQTGTKKMKARPFLEQGLEGIKPAERFATIIRRAFNEDR